jgi:hypothetical protein
VLTSHSLLRIIIIIIILARLLLRSLALDRSFKHFTFFIHEFDLIDKKELAPMAELIEMNLTGKGAEPKKDKAAAGAKASPK